MMSLQTLFNALSEFARLHQNVALRNKLEKVLEATCGDQRNRVIKLAKRLCERTVKDLLSNGENNYDLWNLLKGHGCEYLPSGNQDRVIGAVIRVFCCQPRPWLPRAELAHRVLHCLQTEWNASSPGCFPFSKTKVGHVIEILRRGNSFLVCSSVDWNGKTVTLWQLRDELLDFRALRRVHDCAVVQLAQSKGLYLSPMRWSAQLYPGVAMTAYFQSIVDNQQLRLHDLLQLPQLDFLGEATKQALLGLARIPDNRDYVVSEQELQLALLAVFVAITESRKQPANLASPLTVSSAQSSASGYVSPAEFGDLSLEDSFTFDRFSSLLTPGIGRAENRFESSANASQLVSPSSCCPSLTSPAGERAILGRGRMLASNSEMNVFEDDQNSNSLLFMPIQSRRNDDLVRRAAQSGSSTSLQSPWFDRSFESPVSARGSASAATSVNVSNGDSLVPRSSEQWENARQRFHAVSSSLSAECDDEELSRLDSFVSESRNLLFDSSRFFRTPSTNPPQTIPFASFAPLGGARR